MTAAHVVSLVVVRHGETVDNVAARIQGQSQGQLTQRGLAQAAALGVRLRGERFDRVYCSDLARARDTLACCAVVCNESDVVYSPLLRERAAGALEGLPMSAMQDAVAKAAGVSERQWKPEGGESWADVRQRATLFLTDVAKLGGTKRVLAVTHGGFIHELMAAAGVKAHGRMGNTCVNELAVRRTANGGISCTLIVANDTSHLPPELAAMGDRSA
jgi:broad specificity phosphatase PhoE